MKRALRIAAPFFLGALVFVVAGPGVGRPADAAQAQSVPDVFEASAVAGGLHAEIAVPAFFEIFGPYAMSEATNGSSHSYQAPGYGGFFLTAAAEQFGFPPLPGTTETLFPQGPTSAGTPPAPVDGNGFESSGRSTANGSSGRSVIARGAAAPAFDVGLGEAASSVLADAKGVTSRSSITMEDVELADGIVSIDQVTGHALSRSTGKRGGGATDGSIAMTGLRVAGIPIDLRADGLVVAGTPLTLPDSGLPINDFLSAAGITIERLPNVHNVSADGREAKIRVGGIRFTFAQPAAEVRFSVTIGDLVTSTRVLDLPDVATSTPDDGRATQGQVISEETPALCCPRQIDHASVITEPQAALTTRRIVRSEPARGGDWIAIAAIAALAAPLALIIRRAFRAAARP
jgi:hypothetical protein